MSVVVRHTYIQTYMYAKEPLCIYKMTHSVQVYRSCKKKSVLKIANRCVIVFYKTDEYRKTKIKSK